MRSWLPLEPKNGWRNKVFTNPVSMDSFYEQEQRASRELEMAQTRGRRRKYIARDL
jgi:hypothetical protein